MRETKVSKLTKRIAVLKRKINEVDSDLDYVSGRLDRLEHVANAYTSFKKTEDAFWKFVGDYNRRFQMAPEYVIQSDNLVQELIEAIRKEVQRDPNWAKHK